jgi:hypothetical protein
MDVAAFSGAEFDPKEWINSALQQAEPGQGGEAAAGSLVSTEEFAGIIKSVP